MSADELAWLIPVAVVGLVILNFWLNARSDRRRVQHFQSLAVQLKAKATQQSEFAWSFPVDVGGRSFVVEIAYRGGGAGSSTSGTSYFIVSTKLRGHAWDLHSVTIRRRFGKGGPAFEETFKVQEFGMPMPEWWLTSGVKSAITTVDATEVPRGELLIEEGFLRSRASGSINKITPDALKKLLTRLGELATALERARG